MPMLGAQDRRTETNRITSGCAQMHPMHAKHANTACDELVSGQAGSCTKSWPVCTPVRRVLIMMTWYKGYGIRRMTLVRSKVSASVKSSRPRPTRRLGDASEGELSSFLVLQVGVFRRTFLIPSS